MHNVLHLLQLAFNAQQFVGLQRVLPLAQVLFRFGELDQVVCCELAVKQARGLERLAELHDELVQHGESSPLVVLVVRHGRGRYAVETDPAVALADVIFQRDARFVALGDAARDRARVEVNEVLRDAPLVKPEVLKVHLRAQQLGVLSLPLVDVNRDQSH